jgi:drug/metabolite transporter (DMT)-like permease
MVGAIVVWSLYTIAGRALATPPITATGVQAGITSVLLTPIGLLTGAAWPGQPATVWALLFIAVFPSVGAYALWNVAAKRVPAGRAGLFLNLITVFTVIIAVALGARLTVPEIAGGLLVFAGVGVGSARLRRAPALATR